MSVSTLSIGILASLLATIPIIYVFTDKSQKYEEKESQQNEGSFTVLSYNIAGLWDIISETQTKKSSSSIPSHNPATYEEIVGEIPSAKEIAGKIGEDAVSKAIWTACEYDKRYYKLLRNVYIPKLNGKYSEIFFDLKIS